MRFWIFLFSLTLSIGATAQQRLSFSDALSMMMENNKAISSATYGVDAAYRECRATQGLRMPQIDLVGCYTLMQHDIDIDLGGSKGVVSEALDGFIKGGVANGVIPSTVASLFTDALAPLMGANWCYTLQNRHFGFMGTTLTIPIYLGGRIGIMNRVAKLNVESAEIDLNGIIDSLITELVKQYYGVVLAREVVAVKRAVIQGVEQHLSEAEAMEMEGVVAHSVVLYLQYKLSEAERDYNDALSELNIAERALQSTIQSDNKIESLENMFINYDIDTLDFYRDSALSLNTIIDKTENAKQLSSEGVNLARSAFMPEVVAMGGASIYPYNLSNMIPRWAVGVGLSMPLFGGLTKQEEYKASQSIERSVSQMAAKAREEILLLVDKEYYTLQSALLHIASSERSITLAESYYTTALEGFREGITPSSELMDARIALAASKVEFLNSLYNYIVSLARLLEVSGLSNNFINYASNGAEVDINIIID